MKINCCKKSKSLPARERGLKPQIPRSGNYLEDCKDDELLQEELEDKLDQAENACDDR
jgi:hypothetical protein